MAQTEYYWANRARILARAGEAARAEKYVEIPLDELPWLERQFWKRFDRGPFDQCWPWRGTKTDRGYGTIERCGEERRAHQVAWEVVHRRPVPKGLQIMHTCDNPPCGNPTHLRSGTNADNVADMMRKGRHAKISCEEHSCSKLTRAQVDWIRQAYIERGSTWEAVRAIHKELQGLVTIAHVWNIIKMRTWKSRLEVPIQQ